MPVEREDDEALEASTTSWMFWGAVLILALALAFPVYRAVEPSRRAAAEDKLSAQLATQGAEIYQASCAECHGVEGRGGLGSAIGSKQFLANTSDEQIGALIATGVPGTKMSAYSVDNFGPLTLEQIDSVVFYLRSLEEDAPEVTNWQFPLSDEQLTGRELYTLACSNCHGTDLQGDEEIPDLGPGSDAEEESDDRIAARIREGEDEMPSFGGTLTQSQIDQIVEYLRSEQQS